VKTPGTLELAPHQPAQARQADPRFADAGRREVGPAQEQRDVALRARGAKECARFAVHEIRRDKHGIGRERVELALEVRREVLGVVRQSRRVSSRKPTPGRAHPDIRRLRTPVRKPFFREAPGLHGRFAGNAHKPHRQRRKHPHVFARFAQHRREQPDGDGRIAREIIEIDQ
jgi:hypothetical protein